MNLQLRWDLYHAQQSEKKELKAIRPFTAKMPNKATKKATKKALEAARMRRNLKSFDSAKTFLMAWPFDDDIQASFTIQQSKQAIDRLTSFEEAVWQNDPIPLLKSEITAISICCSARRWR
jgi:hypothetical protein